MTTFKCLQHLKETSHELKLFYRSIIPFHFKSSVRRLTMERLERIGNSLRNERTAGGMSTRQLLRLKSMSKSTKLPENVGNNPGCFRSKLQKASSESKLSLANNGPPEARTSNNSSLLSVSNFICLQQQAPPSSSLHRRPRSLSSTRNIMEEALRIGEDSDLDDSERSVSMRLRNLDLDIDDVTDISLSDFSYSSWKSYWNLRPSTQD